MLLLGPPENPTYAPRWPANNSASRRAERHPARASVLRGMTRGARSISARRAGDRWLPAVIGDRARWNASDESGRAQGQALEDVQQEPLVERVPDVIVRDVIRRQ